MVYGNFLGKFSENSEMLNFCKAKFSSLDSGYCGKKNYMKRKFPLRYFGKINLGTPREVSLFPEIPENAVPFAK